jgi:uroporphyrinogen-III synthase
MNLPLAILRPEPGWSRTAGAARDCGIEIAGRPLFRVEPVAWRVPDGRFDALLAGSANVFRHGGERLAELKLLGVHCVGPATAQAAREAGFSVASTGTGGLQALIDAMARPCSLLRLAGEERVPLDPGAGISVEEVIVYRSRALALDRKQLPSAAVIALHSARAARHFASEIDRLRGDRSGLVICALAPRVAEAAGDGWSAVHIADAPNEAALLELARALCQGSAMRGGEPRGSRNG